MYPSILCLCGFSTGDLYDIFQAMRADKFAALGTDMDPNLATFCDEEFGDKAAMEAELNSLDVGCMCCRSKLMTQVTFIDYYN